MAGRVQNLKPWPKGVSGNPGGRPRNDVSAEIACAIFEQNADLIYNALVGRIARGDVRLFQVLADRAYGKVKITVEQNTNDLYAERLEAARKRVVEGMSQSEIEDKIESLQRELGIRIKGDASVCPQS